MKNKRRKVLIHSLQIRYSLYSVLAMTLIMVLAIINTYLDVLSILNEILPKRGESYIVFLDLLTPMLPLKMFLIIVISILLGILVTHRIAGPIYRFKNVFQRIGRGELNIGAVKLRQGDELHKEADELSAMIESLRGPIKDIKEDINTLSSQPHASPQTKDIIDRLKEKVSFFKI